MVNANFLTAPLALAAATWGVEAQPSEWRSTHSRAAPLLSKVVEGKGNVKAIEITNPASEYSHNYDLEDLHLTITWNGGSASRDVALRRPHGIRSGELSPGQSITICSEAAIAADKDGSLCGQYPLVGHPYEYSVMKFNGNDMLQLDVREHGKKTRVLDVFGDLSSEKFNVCGRPRANILSTLKRVPTVKKGNPVPGDSFKNCEWSWLPIDAREFTKSGDWWPAITESNLVISENCYYGDCSFTVDPQNLFLSTDGGKEVRIADLPRTEDFNPTDKQIRVCILQDSYSSTLEGRCDYLWEVDGAGAIAENGQPIKFDWEVSGKLTVDPKYLRTQVIRYSGPKQELCTMANKTDVETEFGGYVESYVCNEDKDCDAIGENIFKSEAECAPGALFYGETERLPSYCKPRVNVQSFDRCTVDDECPANEFCSLAYANECNNRQRRMKYSSLTVMPVEINPNQVATFNFDIQFMGFNYGAIDSKMHVISSANPDNLKIKFGINPNEIDVGTNVIFRENTNCDKAVEMVGEVFRATYPAGLLYDTGHDGKYEFTITNDAEEPVTIEGLFWDIEAQED